MALGLIACLPAERGGAGGAEAPAVSAAPSETHPCAGATAIPPAVDAQRTLLESPVRDHCEVHRLGGGTPALFVRTMNTVAHDDQGAGIPTCQWEVFYVAPATVRHLGTLSVCRFRVDGGCVVGMGEGARAAPRVCFESPR